MRFLNFCLRTIDFLRKPIRFTSFKLLDYRIPRQNGRYPNLFQVILHQHELHDLQSETPITNWLDVKGQSTSQKLIGKDEKWLAFDAAQFLVFVLEFVFRIQ
jgi:hypothetical protein